MAAESRGGPKCEAKFMIFGKCKNCHDSCLTLAANIEPPVCESNISPIIIIPCSASAKKKHGESCIGR